MPVSLGEKLEGGVLYEYVNFSGRDTGMGRVTIYGVLATNAITPSHECVLLFGDSGEGIDEALLAYFVKNGYSALCVDYAGKRAGADRYTEYPENVVYANLSQCGRYKDFVDVDAEKTCWYEWVAVGVFARKYLSEKFATENVGLVGIKDGGEIAWKLAAVRKFACMVAVNACGWKAYNGYSKFQGNEPQFDDERYRFIAGIDSQSYAPYVKCPVLILCSTCDPSFDYDRAYDTFSRINREFAAQSSVSYSVNSGLFVDLSSTKDMFMFLDSFVKERHVFMPKPAEISVEVDDLNNLIARINCDGMGIIEKCGVYLAEDCYDFATRDWTVAPLKRVINPHESEFYLNVYEKSSAVFVVCYAVYSNGFTVWSKLAFKKIGGKFRNSRTKSKIIYTNKFGSECFSVADCSSISVGGIFLTDNQTLPQIVTRNNLSGIYAKGGLITNRIKTPQFSPDADSILKFDICTDEDALVEVKITNHDDGNVYSVTLNIIGGVWQSQILSAKVFKNERGISLTDFTRCDSLAVICDEKFALNNLIWL